RYERRMEVIKERRVVVWYFVAPLCLSCGFDQHPSAMELHHPKDKAAQIQDLVPSISLTLDFGHIEALFREAALSIPLCSNCHRMLHAGAIPAPAKSVRSNYRIASLLDQLKAIE